MNNLIWIKCSNIVYVEREVLKLRNSSAMINFNNRVCVILNVFRGANTESEYFTKICCVKKDCQRIMSMKMKSISESKTRRKKLRAIRKKYIDVNKHKESVFCEASWCFGKRATNYYSKKNLFKLSSQKQVCTVIL